MLSLPYSRWNRKKATFYSRQYLRNRSSSDILGIFGLVGVIYPQERCRDVWQIHSEALCIMRDWQTSFVICSTSAIF